MEFSGERNRGFRLCAFDARTVMHYPTGSLSLARYGAAPRSLPFHWRRTVRRAARQKADARTGEGSVLRISNKVVSPVLKLPDAATL
jgi:hypothetical protein